MVARASYLWGVGVLAVLAGCPNPNVYGTPRTIPKGTSQHTVAAEGLGVVGVDKVPVLPTYQYRAGLRDDVDMGFRIANLTSLGFDVKWNFYREKVDLAVVPGFTGTYVVAAVASDRDDSS